MQSHLDVVKGIYAAFLRGDIPAILNRLSENVDWKNPGAPGVPYAGERKSKAEVAEFFRIFAESVEVLQFEPRNYTASTDQVGAFGYFKARARPTGKEFDYEWATWWKLRDDKVLAYRAFVDTATEAAAFVG